MPFEPRIIRHNDPNDADEFPSPELALLAEQLAEDAAFLAERYPAAAPGVSHAPSALTASGALEARKSAVKVLVRPRGRWWLAAAVVLVAVGLGTGVFVAGQFVKNSAPQRLTAEVAQPLAKNSRVASSQPHHEEPSPGTDPSLPEVLPAMSFQELTGPEQEAVLDLLEDEILRQASLSI